MAKKKRAVAKADTAEVKAATKKKPGQKECPECKTLVGARTLECPTCKHAFKAKKKASKRKTTATVKPVAAKPLTPHSLIEIAGEYVSKVGSFEGAQKLLDSIKKIFTGK